MNRIDNTSPLERYEIKSGDVIASGTLVALDSDGKAVSAGDISGISVIGVAGSTIDGSVEVLSGVFALAGAGVSRAARGKAVYVKDASTVDLTGGTNKVSAGIVVDVYDGDVYVDMTPAALACAANSKVN